jgi:glycosyltransferase involved in cell wall biosynthesis
LELVIVDDASTDRSLSLVSELSQSDRRVKVISLKENSGIAVARNTGIAACSSDLVAMLDSDDICLPGRIERQLEQFYNDPDLVLSGTCAYLIDDAGKQVGKISKPITDEQIKKTAFYAGPFVQSSIMFRKQEILAVGGYRKEYSLIDDIDLYLRVIYSGKKTSNLPEYLIKYRVHSQQSDSGNVRRKAIASYRLKKELISRNYFRPSLIQFVSMYAHLFLDLVLPISAKKFIERLLKSVFRV